MFSAALHDRLRSDLSKAAVSALRADISVVFGRASDYQSCMRRSLAGLLLASIVAVNAPAVAASGSLLKVLPEFLDLKGRTALSPSLYERDAYQMTLRMHPERRSGIRFYLEWKAKKPAWEPLLARV